MNTPAHLSVLAKESLAGLAIDPKGIYVDATFGRGGHSRLILNQLGEEGLLIAIDRDKAAGEYAKEHFSKIKNFHFIHGNMSDIKSHLAQLDITKVNGILMDIGVSSPQLDEAERGFSFMQDGPLDMRMNQEEGLSAHEWVMTTSIEEMARVFKQYGEERYAPLIAKEIAKVRQEKSIETTFQLVEIIKQVMPQRGNAKKHPATRVFQAIRIAINRELDELIKALESTLTLLKKGGRLVVITFHSLEDRIVKQFMREHSEVKDLFPELPILIEGEKPILKIIGKAIKASEQESQQNRRARSAILRVAEKII